MFSCWKEKYNLVRKNPGIKWFTPNINLTFCGECGEGRSFKESTSLANINSTLRGERGGGGVYRRSG